MSSTNPACPLCGMRFGSRPLLDLHIREDHRQHATSGLNDDRDPGGARAPADGTDSSPGVRAAAATPPQTPDGRKPKRNGFAGQAMAALRRAFRTGRSHFSSAA